MSPKVILQDKMDYPNLQNNNQLQNIQRITISFLNKNVPKQPLFNKPKQNLAKRPIDSNKKRIFIKIIDVASFIC